MVGARAVAFAINRAVDKEIDARNPRTAGARGPGGRHQGVGALALRRGHGGRLPLRGLPARADHALAVADPARRVPRVSVPEAVHVARALLAGHVPRPRVHRRLGRRRRADHGVAPWVFSLAVAVWTAGFDIIYATQDYECDVRDGVHSMPADYGIGPALVQTRDRPRAHDRPVRARRAGAWAPTWPYYVGVAVAAALLVYENAIVSEDDLSRVNAAFFLVNGFIAIIILAGVDRRPAHRLGEGRMKVYTVVITGASGSVYGLRLVEQLLLVGRRGDRHRDRGRRGGHGVRDRVLPAGARRGGAPAASSSRSPATTSHLRIAARRRPLRRDRERLAPGRRDDRRARPRWASAARSPPGSARRSPSVRPTCSSRSAGRSSSCRARRRSPSSTCAISRRSPRRAPQVLPATPAFYGRPETLDDAVNFVVGKVLDQLGVENALYRRWRE